uniref:Peptidase M3A/M3B catalytic domain-containing protein n=1 Tax=Magallana gigas TaxID=29159 RepID=A0A8W8I6E5_MAGGI
MRQDVFDILVAFEKKSSTDGSTESKRYVERMIKLWRRNGLHLPTDKQQKIKEIKKRMSDLSIDLVKTLMRRTPFLPSQKKSLVTLKYPHYTPCMKKARNPETRKKLETAFNSRCLKPNTAIIEELVELRSQKADILGFPTHAAFVLDMRMAKDPEKVRTFLVDLAQKLRPLQEQEVKVYLEYKKEKPGCIQPDGKRQISVAAMVANFTKPTEVETYFHEFGPVMHQICAQSEFALFSGTSVERDFVEAPSQMLENWCWEKEPLQRMSKHYKTGEAIPDHLLDKLIKSWIANAGMFNLRQILLGMFDQTIHTQKKVDIAKLFSEISQEYLGFPSI